MKFQIRKEELEKAMAKLETILPTRDTQNLLSNVLLRIEKEQICLTASDMESTVKITLNAENTEPGELIIRAKKLSEIVKSLNSENLIFRASPNKEKREEDEISYIVYVEGGDQNAAKFKKAGGETTHFPNINEIASDKLSLVPADILNEMISKTFYAASQEDNRYVFNGLCMQAEANKLTVVGTDGRRLSAITREIPSPINLGDENSPCIIVHSKAIRELQKILEISPDVYLGLEQQDIFFQVGNAQLASRLISGKFPDYQKVVPSENKIDLDLDRSALLDALRQVMVMSEPPSFQVKLSIKKGVMLLLANTPDVGEAEIQINIDYSGDPFKIGFNSNYLLDILRSLKCKTIKVSLSDAEGPIIIYDTEDEDFTALFMPMKI